MAEEGFHDYTLATNLERLVAQVEQCFRGWMLTGLEHLSHMAPAVGNDKQPTNIVRVSNNLNHRLPWREQPYILTLHVPYTREAELQAARQQQYQQQQQQPRQHQEQQQQQQAVCSSERPIVAEPLQSAAAAAEERVAAVSVPDQAAAAAAAEDSQQQQQEDHWQHVTTVEPGGVGTVDDTLADIPTVATADATTGGSSSGSSEQLDQRVQDLIEEYRQLHLQLQEDETAVKQQQQQHEEGQEGSTNAVDASQVQLQLGRSGASDNTTAAVSAAAAERQFQSQGSTAVAAAAAALAAVATEAATAVPSDASSASGAAKEDVGRTRKSPESSKPPKAAVPALNKLVSSSSSSSTAAAAAAEEASESDETDENNTRQVDLPAPDDLLLPNSSALAAAQAAVRRDQSSTAVSRTWWPHCFAAAGSSSTLTAAAAAVCERILPSSYLTPLRPPWWAPVSSIHKLQRWFGLDLFVLLQPASFSRRFLDQAEASSLLSLGRLALSSSGVMRPLLLPVHDALRDAYCGVAQVAGSSVYFTSDSIHVSRLPRHLTTPYQQISILADQLAPHNAAAAAACLAAIGQAAAGSSSSSSGQYVVSMSACCTYRLPDVSKMHWLQQQQHHNQQQQQQRRSSQLHSYPGSSRSSFSSDVSLRNPSASHNPHPAGLRHLRFDEEDLDGIDWDADSAWHPWAQQRDPITALELDLIWEDRQIWDPDQAPVRSEIRSKVPDHSLHVTAGDHNHDQDHDYNRQQQQSQISSPEDVISAESAADLLSNVSAADHWLLHVVSHGYSSPPLRQGRLGMRSANRHRRHVSLAAAGAEWLWTADLAQQVLSEGGRLSGVCPQPYNYDPGSSGSSSSKRQVPLDPGSFTTMLSALITARTAAAAANSLWELAGADWWESRGESALPPLPPESVLDSVIRDLFSPPKAFELNPVAATGSSSSGDLPRSAPAGSLLCRLALHALVFGNARAVAALWQRFVSQIRLQFWEQRALLPYMHAAEQQQQQQGLARSGSSIGSLQGSATDLGRSRSKITRSGLSNVVGGPPAPDLDACLLNQKLQMLNICIWRRDKRLSRGLSFQQQQQQVNAAAAAVEGVESSVLGSDVIEDSSSTRDGVITAASSGFFSAAEDDDDDLAAAAAAAEGDQAEVTSQAEEPSIQQQQQQSSNNFVDARSEFGSVTSSTTGFNSALHQSDLLQQQQEQEQQQQIEGVDRIIPDEYLLNFSDRPLRVPIVQEELVFTEDQIIERQTALMHLAEASATAAAASSSSSNRLLIASAGVTAAAEDAPAAADAELLLLRQRLLAAPMLSDMSAFKAANPGCCLEDFLRWYSPKDSLSQQQQQQQQQQPQDHPDQPVQPRSPQSNVLQQQQQQSDHPDHSDRPRSPKSKVSSSPAAAQQSSSMPRSDPGSWQNLWTIAPPLPAAAQRPLLHPNKEGEQVLHYLETISPAALFGQLLAAAVNEALALLSSSRGAALPSAAAVITRFRSMAAAVLKKGGGISEALAAAAAPQQQQHLAGDWQGAEGGLLDIELELLLAEFHYVEQVIVLGESLLCRLPGQRDLAARLLDHLVQGCGSSSSSSDLSRSEGDLGEIHATEARVLGLVGNLPVARVSNTEALGLLKWVAAAAQRTSAAAATVWQQQQQQQDVSQLRSGTGPDSSLQSMAAAAAAQTAQDGLLPSRTSASTAHTIGSSSSSNERQQIQKLQRHLGEPAQWQWVTTCADSATAAPSVSSSSNNSSIKLKPSVAAAVAAAAGAGGATAAASVPPSRMYVQEADGEMRMAFTLVSDTRF